MTDAPTIYGTAPIDLGIIDIAPTEMMFWLYAPIKLPNWNEVVIPPNLQQFAPIVEACFAAHDLRDWEEKYVYLTAKTLWVTQDNPAQRRGWHCDGFMTDDVNYIWADRFPTLFADSSALHGAEGTLAFTQEHKKALEEMDAYGTVVEMAGLAYSFPVKTLLRLDQTVLHRVGDFDAAGMRSFVKLSVSRHKFNLKGNSINHALADQMTDWDYGERGLDRNAEAYVRLTDHERWWGDRRSPPSAAK